MDDISNATDWYREMTATFGDRLAAAREQAGLSQKSLANRLGIKTSTLRNWENDLSEPRANRLNMLAGLLGVSISWLITGEGEGVSAPEDQQKQTAEFSEVLTELRQIRAQLTNSNERIARLEKRLFALSELNPE